MNVNLYVKNQSHAYIFLLQLPRTLSTVCLWLCFGALKRITTFRGRSEKYYYLLN